MPILSIIIPVYFNENSLSLLFQRLLEIEKTLLQKNIILELIFVDDGSGDNSWQKLKDIKQKHTNTKIIKLSRNFGSFNAIRTGLDFVTGDCFMYLSADLQDPPELILEMVDKWLAGFKYIVCERNKRHDAFSSKFFSYIYYKIIRFFVIKDYPKGGFDLVLMDKIFLPYLQQATKHINILLFSYWLGFKPAIIKYTRAKRIHGKSRWTINKKIKLFIDSICGFSVFPLRIASAIGFAVSIFSFSYGLFIFINTVFGHIKVPGFAAVITTLSFLSGIIILMLGIIGEFIWRIFDKLNNYPEAVIDEIL